MNVTHEVRQRTYRLTRAAERAVGRAALLSELASAKAAEAIVAEDERFWRGLERFARDLLDDVVTIEQEDFGTDLGWMPDHKLDEINEWLKARASTREKGDGA